MRKTARRYTNRYSSVLFTKVIIYFLWERRAATPEALKPLSEMIES